MNITKDTVASFHYTLTNDDGDVIDTSMDGEPLSYLHGAHNIVVGLENALAGKKAGDALQVSVSPAEGYGEYDEQFKQSLPRELFTGIETIEAGMEFHAQTPQGTQVVSVVSVDGDNITVDGNHPLAGQALHFDVTVTHVREASLAEIDQGQVQPSPEST